MAKKSMKNKAFKIISKLATNMAWSDTSNLCMYYLYQPKCPKALKKNAK